MTKLLGKQIFEEKLGDLLEKTNGKLTLVSIDDKRKEVKTNNIEEEFGGKNYGK